MRSIFLRTASLCSTTRIVALKRAAPAVCDRSSSLTAAIRSFATARLDLLSVIKKEFEEEQVKGRTKMSEELVELRETIKKQAWRVVDDGGMTKMHRNNNSTRIRVSFHCQDMIYEHQNDSDEEDYDEEDRKHLEDEENFDGSGDFGVPPGTIRFVATATPVKTSKSLVFQCTAELGTPRIDAVSVEQDVDNLEKLHSSNAEYNMYTGPVFEELDDQVQTEFIRYLDIDMGITSDVATFINLYAHYKEQQNYVKWLTEVETVLK